MNDEYPPTDIVPPTGLTLETLRQLNDMVDREVTFTKPGEVLTDPDGVPIGVGPSTTSVATMAGATFTRAELDRLGGHPKDFPNLSFTTPEGETTP